MHPHPRFPPCVEVSLRIGPFGGLHARDATADCTLHDVAGLHPRWGDFGGETWSRWLSIPRPQMHGAKPHAGIGISLPLRMRFRAISWADPGPGSGFPGPAGGKGRNEPLSVGDFEWAIA
jgi:hypothetical protein